MKIIKFKDQAKQKLLTGIRILADSVGTTLGPRGQNVAIDKGFESLVIHDGVGVAKQVESGDEIENLGIKIVREAAQKQVMVVGDGTTLVTVLADEIIRECHKMTSAGINPMSLRQGLETGAEKLVKAIRLHAKPISSLESKTEIATISSEDEKLGKLVAEVLDKKGINGIVTVEESKSSDTFVEYQDGMQFEHGYLSHLFITDPETQEAVIEKPYLFITDKSLGDVSELIPFFNKIAQQTKNVVFIAPEIAGTTLPSLITTKLQGGANVLAVQAPMAGEKQKLFLQDIAILTGGKLISKDAGMKFEDVTIEDLGRAEKIVSTKNTTLIIGGYGDKAEIESRIKGLENALEEEKSEYEQEKLKERIAKLTDGVAVIKVGGATEIEMKERKERVIDAVAAVRAAMKEGVVAGGETIFEKIGVVLDQNDLGEKVLKNAILRPFNTLVGNAGLDAGEMRTLLGISKIENAGVDVTDGKIKNMIKQGIIDPALVPIEAIKNSVSVAIQIMSVGAVIVNKNEKLSSLPPQRSG